MFSVLVIRLRSLRLLRVSGIVMRLRMFLLLITFLKASHSFRNRDRKSGSAGMPRPTSYAVFCLKKKIADHGVGDHELGVPKDREVLTQQLRVEQLDVAGHRADRFFFMIPPPPRYTLFPYTTLFRSLCAFVCFSCLSPS